jgi:hypothetical protein
MDMSPARETAPRAPRRCPRRDGEDGLACEWDELAGLADAAARLVPGLAGALARSTRLVHEAIAGAAEPLAVERVLDAFAQELRHRWITSAALAASRDFRTPLSDHHLISQTRQPHDFGYERDLQPEQLEGRCHAFFPPPPAPWRVDHLLYCSGQAAMTGALLLLEGDGLGGTAPPVPIAHFGAYFETVSLLRLFPSLLRPVGPDDGFAACIAEPVRCDGRFAVTDMQQLARRLARAPARLVIVDDTLRGRHGDLNAFLREAGRSLTVARVHSGLKLLQSGLELANVGLLSLYGTHPGRLARLAARLRANRTLLDGGLRLVDVAALEFPGFLAAAPTLAYEAGIFGNNAALARAMAGRNGIFAPVGHPSLGPFEECAPYCTFRLRDASEQAYHALENRIRDEARRRRVQFDQGGSFGFRGHRYEVVRPDGQAPFLRVAMGRRGGWSRQGVIGLMCDIAAGR